MSRKLTPAELVEKVRKKEREKQLKYERNRAEHLFKEQERSLAIREAKRSMRANTPVPTTPQEFIAKAEASLSRMLDMDNVAAVIFTLKSLGAAKGWVEGGKEGEVDLGKLKELKSFFDSVGDKKASKDIAPTLVEPVNAVLQSPAYECELSPIITSDACVSPLQNSESISGSLERHDSLRGNTDQRKTNFP